MTDIIIPIKSLDLAKQRLAAVLTPCERKGLVLAMLEDLLETLACLEHGSVLVVASDEAVFDTARRFGARPVREFQANGYNEAITLGLAEVPEDKNVVVLPGDIPLASASDLAALIAESDGGEQHVRLAPTHDLQGTNGLFQSTKGLIKQAFGPNSFANHIYASHEHGIRPEIIEAPGLGLDIDTPADLNRFATRSTAGAAHRFLGQMRGAVTNDIFDRGAA